MSPKTALLRLGDQNNPMESLANDTGSDNDSSITYPNRIQTRSWRGLFDDLLSGERRAIEARFWAKVNTQGPVPASRPDLGPCWLWTASAMDTQGHGQFTIRVDGQQRHVYAHRVAWELSGESIPDGKCVCHHCDNPPCVAPAHLFLGSQGDNLRDAGRKGRLGRHLIKVSDEGLADIRATYHPRHNGRQLAAKYGITLVSLLRIVNGTQRVSHPAPVLERVPSRQLPILGEVA